MKQHNHNKLRPLSDKKPSIFQTRTGTRTCLIVGLSDSTNSRDSLGSNDRVAKLAN